MRHQGLVTAARRTHRAFVGAMALFLALITALACGAPSAERVVTGPSAEAETVVVETAPTVAPEAPALAYEVERPVEPTVDARVANLGPVIELAPAAPPAIEAPVEAVAEAAAVDHLDTAGWAFFDTPDASIVEGLREQPVVAVERGRGGRSLGFRLDFEDGSRGYFKPNQAFSGMSWNAEIAAHRLDRELGLGRVAPVVSRRIDYSVVEAEARGDGRVDELHVSEDGTLIGAVIYWVPQRLRPVELPDGWQRWLRIEGNPAAVTPFQRPSTYRTAIAAHRTTPMPEGATPDTAERPSELSDLIVFDYLTNNLDRWGGNNTNIRTVGEGGPIMFLDNAASFTLRRARNSMMDRRLHEVQRFNRSTIDAVRALDVEAYGERVNEDPNGTILSDLHLRNLETRRQHLLEYVDGLVAQHGAEAVYSL